MNTEHDRRRAPIAAQIAYLEESFGKILNAMDENPEIIGVLTDRELLALAGWQEDWAVRAECNRREAEHQKQARRFAAFRDQLALVADLPDDTPWSEARSVIAERLKKS
jgi:hypothetical protein